MFETLMMSVFLTYGAETIDTNTPLGEVDANVHQAMVMVENDKGWVVGGTTMGISPDVGPKMKMDDWFVGYKFLPLSNLTIVGSDTMWAVQYAHPLPYRFYLSGSYMDREMVDRAVVGIGYHMSKNFSIQANYGVADFRNGFDSNMIATTFVYRY